MIQSLPHQANIVEEVLWHKYGCQWSSLLVFIDDVTANRSSRMNSEVYGVIQPNAAKLMGGHFTTWANSSEHSKRKQRNGVFFSDQVCHLISTHLSMRSYLLETKRKAERPTDRQQQKAAVEDWQSISRVETWELVT